MKIEGLDIEISDNYPAETYQIIQEHEPVHRDIRDHYKYTDIDVKNFKTKDIEPLYFMICFEPESVGYGVGLGAFVYKDGRVFQFHYNCHTTYSKGPRLSNQMTSKDELVLDTRHGITLVTTKGTTFGQKAFWQYTPVDCLNDEERSLREFITFIQSYCRKMDFCKRLRKTDRAHEKWEERNKS